MFPPRIYVISLSPLDGYIISGGPIPNSIVRMTINSAEEVEEAMKLIKKGTMARLNVRQGGGPRVDCMSLLKAMYDEYKKYSNSPIPMLEVEYLVETLRPNKNERK